MQGSFIEMNKKSGYNIGEGFQPFSILLFSLK